jgi:myosin heavy subunit
MNVIGLSKDEQDSIFRMLAIILWLGNVQFAEGDDGNSAVIIDENGIAKKLACGICVSNSDRLLLYQLTSK